MDIPRYDPEAHCKVIAEFGGTYSATTYNFCVNQEQAAYNELKRRWADFGSRAKAHCDQVANFSGDGSYNTLKFCIEQEEQATVQKKGFKF